MHHAKTKNHRFVYDKPMVTSSSIPEVAVLPVRVDAVRGEAVEPRTDVLAVEEPLEIRVVFGPRAKREQKALAVTMRTPGHDAELAAGFLFGEGLLTDPDDVEGIVPCGQPLGPHGVRNVVRVELRPGVTPNLPALERHVYTTSSCGVCGKTSLHAVTAACRPANVGDGPIVPASQIHELPGRLRESQPTFARTGGLHACALFDIEGQLLAAREDVGRHNAADKLIGSEFLAGRTPLSDRILFVSGRASFELVQKAAAAGVPIFAAVGAPSSLAVDLARRFGMTLLGFVRDGRFNVYCGAERIQKALTTAAQRTQSSTEKAHSSL
jgi:FdhD protein